MSGPVLDVIDMEVEVISELSVADKKNAQSAKLERRRRIEELNEEKFMREEWGEF